MSDIWKNRIVGHGEESPDQLLASPFNHRIHPKRQQDALSGSLETLGLIQTVIVNKTTGHIVDGHLRVTMALREGQPLIPVTYVELTAEEEAQALLSLDPIAAMAASDRDKVDELLRMVNTDNEQVMKHLADFAAENKLDWGQPEQVDAEPQIDRAAELAEKWQTSAGQLWRLGEHRLLIGDCTVRENVERLMGGERADMTFIDPPYNALKSWNKDEAHSETRLDPSEWFENDNMEWDKYWEFMARMFDNLQGHSVYICCDFRIYDGLKPLVEAAGYKVKHCIVWKKNVWGLGKRYRFQHEFIIYACKDKAPFYGDRSQSDVWEMDIKKTTEHNTPKPVELPQKAISNSLENGAIMFDGCCGHGTTIIAAHNLNRRCYAMEISEKYAAVILERFQTATGIQPELIK